MYHDEMRYLPQLNGQKPPTREEVNEAITSTLKRKATGPDGISIELLLGAGEVGVEMTTALIQKMWAEGTVPQELKRAHILLLPKTVPPSKDPDKQRPISLLNLWYKLLDKIIKKRLENDIRERAIISDEQAGFMSGKSC
jgi:hypothetical protein